MKKTFATLTTIAVLLTGVSSVRAESTDAVEHDYGGAIDCEYLVNRVAHLECLLDCSKQRGVRRLFCEAQCTEQEFVREELAGDWEGWSPKTKQEEVPPPWPTKAGRVL